MSLQSRLSPGKEVGPSAVIMEKPLKVFEERSSTVRLPLQNAGSCCYEDRPKPGAADGGVGCAPRSRCRDSGKRRATCPGWPKWHLKEEDKVRAEDKPRRRRITGIAGETGRRLVPQVTSHPKMRTRKRGQTWEEMMLLRGPVNLRSPRGTGVGVSGG